MTIENNILELLVEGFVSPILQNGDIDKITTWTNGRCESGRHFSVEYRPHLGPWMDGIVGKTYQTYNSLPPCQEIDMSRHKLSIILWVNIRVRLPPSWNPVFGTTRLRFSSRPRFRTRARNPVGSRPGSFINRLRWTCVTRVVPPIYPTLHIRRQHRTWIMILLHRPPMLVGVLTGDILK